jgi:hypothetical protein
MTNITWEFGHLICVTYFQNYRNYKFFSGKAVKLIETCKHTLRNNLPFC